MADVKISALPASTTPLAGTEVLPIVQSATTRQVSVANLTAGRAVNALSLTASSLTSGRVTYAGASGLLTDSANLTFDGTKLDVQNNGDVTTRSYSTNASNQAFVQAVNSVGTYIGLLQYGASKTPYGALGAGKGAVYSTDSVTIMADTATGIINFATGGNTERMRIDSSGSLLVGTTSASGAYRVHIANTPAGTAGVKHLATTTGTSYAEEFYTSDGNSRGYISYTTAGTIYSITSDYRLKENQQTMTGALQKIALLKPKTWSWKEGYSNGQGQGFIAHELQEIFPDAVVGEKDAIDADGKPKYQGVDTSYLVATLTKAIQEQQTLIESLTTRLTALENK